MKRRLLFAMLCIVSALGMRAQTWTASEVGEGYFMLYNVGKGQYLTRGNSWGTQASVSPSSALTVTVEEYNGAYKLRTNIQGDGRGFERLSDPVIFTDQSISKNSTWTFTKVADASNGPVYTVVSADNHSGGAGSYMTASADNTIVGPADAVTDDYGRWQLVQSWITNSIPVNDANGWTVSETPTFDGGNVCAEYWNKSGASIKQTMSNLPAGSYELIAVAFTRTGMTATLNAGTNTMSIATVSSDVVNGRGGANTWFNDGNGVNKLEFTHGGGSLEIGLTADNTTGDHWLVWRSFVLLYKGLDLSEFAAQLEAAVNAAQAIEEGSIPTAAYNALTTVVSANNKSYTTAADYTAATNAIVEATNTAKALQADYSHYKAIRTAAKAWETQTTVYTGDANVNTTEADQAVEEATTVEGINSAIATLRTAAATFLGSVKINENQYFDITAVFLNNADISEGGQLQMPPGWETNYVSGQQANNIGCQHNSDYTNGSVTLHYFIEAWRWSPALGDGYLRQSVSNLPEGKYVLEADAIAADQPGGTRPTGTYLYITADGVNYETTMATGDGQPEHFSTEFLNTGAGDVIFGLKTVNTTANWIAADNFTVKFYGIDLSAYVTQLEETVNAALAVEASTTTTALYEAIQTAVTTYNHEWSSSTEYSAAIAAIQTATNNAIAIAPALEEYNTIKAIVAALKDVEGYTETEGSNATANLTQAIADCDETVQRATAAAEVAVQNNALKAAAKTFLAGVRSDGEHPFDITFFITNPNFDNNNIDGWTRTYEKGTATTRAQVNEFYQSTFDFYQTLTDMPKGNYELKVQAFQRLGDCQTDFTGYMNGTLKPTSVIYINEGTTTIKACAADATDESIYTGDKEVTYEGTTKYEPFSMEGAALRFSQGLYDNTVLTAAEGEMKLGFKSTADPVVGDWTIFDNFRLYFYGNSINVTMDEAVAFSALADIEGANVTMTRNTKAGLNTIALPFDLTEAQVKEIFGDDAVVYAYSDEGEADATTVNFNTAETKIVANVPVLVNVTKASAEIKVDNVTVKTGEAKAEGKNFDFVGNYAGQVTIAAGDWFVSGGKLYESKGTTTIKGFRAYLKDKNPDTTGEVKLYIDGVATAISEINADVQESGLIYNLAGQRVSKATKGIYVINGRKVVVK